MSQEPAAEAVAPPVSMPAEPSETEPPQQQHHKKHRKKKKKQRRRPLSSPSDNNNNNNNDNDGDDGLSEIQPRQQQDQQQEPPPEGLPLGRLRLEPPPSSVPPLSQRKKYFAYFAGTGYDKDRSLWMGDLRPWMDKDYFVNIFRHLGKVVLITVIKNEQMQLPEYGFFELTSTSEADDILWNLNGLPMANSTQSFNFRWATLVCGLRKPFKCFRYDLTATPSTYPAVFYRTLLNIEFVRVATFKSNKRPDFPAEVNGKVTVGFNKLVYDRTEGDGELIGQPGDHLTLTGPLDSISADDGFLIKVELQVNGEEIALGGIHWKPLYLGQPVSHKVDKHFEENVHGEYGHVTVGYSVVTFALIAVVEVLLIIGDGGESHVADVYGIIQVEQYIKKFVSTIRLFDKFEDECVQVQSNRAIPLTRSFVVMPSHGFLITVALCDRVTGCMISNGEDIFKAKSGTQTKRIGGSGYFEVQVSVTCY